jgi:endonuclease YncB( thermonuclease family)
MDESCTTLEKLRNHALIQYLASVDSRKFTVKRPKEKISAFFSRFIEQKVAVFTIKEITDVYDGDTFKITIVNIAGADGVAGTANKNNLTLTAGTSAPFVPADGNEISFTLRIANADAPEIGQEYGYVSKDALVVKTNKILDNKFAHKVYFAFYGFEKYGRVLGEVFFRSSDDGGSMNNGCALQSLSQWMVIEGHAWASRLYMQNWDRSLWKRWQDAAQTQKKGLWANNKPIVYATAPGSTKKVYETNLPSTHLLEPAVYRAWQRQQRTKLKSSPSSTRPTIINPAQRSGNVTGGTGVNPSSGVFTPRGQQPIVPRRRRRKRSVSRKKIIGYELSSNNDTTTATQGELQYHYQKDGAIAFPLGEKCQNFSQEEVQWTQCLDTSVTLEKHDATPLQFQVVTQKEDPRIERGEIFVLRDDRVCGGTKSRVLHRVLRTDPQFLEASSYGYVSSTYGTAALVLAWTAQRLLPKKKVFLVERQPSYPLAQLTAKMGATLVDSVSSALASSPGTTMLPSGFRHPLVEEEIARLARVVRERLGVFDQVWCVCATGTLLRGLQKAGLGKTYHAVNIYPGSGINVAPAFLYENVRVSVGDAEMDVLPPFPSNAHYDAKAWRYVLDARNGASREQKILFWNVAGNYVAAAEKK